MHLRVCKVCGGWDNCPECDIVFIAEQRELRNEQLKLDCGDELPGPGDLRDIRDDGLPGPYDEEF